MAPVLQTHLLTFLKLLSCIDTTVFRTFRLALIARIFIQAPPSVIASLEPFRVKQPSHAPERL